jgi:hypothetical protein
MEKKSRCLVGPECSLNDSTACSGFADPQVKHSIRLQTRCTYEKGFKSKLSLSSATPLRSVQVTYDAARSRTVPKHFGTLSPWYIYTSGLENRHAALVRHKTVLDPALGVTSYAATSGPWPSDEGRNSIDSLRSTSLTGSLLVSWPLAASAHGQMRRLKFDALHKSPSWQPRMAHGNLPAIGICIYV